MISGKHLTATVGGTPLTLIGTQEWRQRGESDKLDGQTAEHEGFSANEPGTDTSAVDITLVQDLTTGIYTIIKNGTTLTDLKLYRHVDDDTPAFHYPIANVFSSDNGSAIKDKFTTKCSIENYGPYTCNDPGD